MKLAREAGLTGQATSELLQIPVRSLYRLANLDLPDTLLPAVRRQLGLLEDLGPARSKHYAQAA